MHLLLYILTSEWVFALRLQTQIYFFTLFCISIFLYHFEEEKGKMMIKRRKSMK